MTHSASESQAVERLVRQNIRSYAHNNIPRSIQAGYLRLHANESPFNSPENRYPDTALLRLKSQWGCHEGIPPRCCYLCNGTEEAVDLTVRIFCEPGRDEVIALRPSRGIYAKRADLNGVGCREVSLRPDDFSLDIDAVDIYGLSEVMGPGVAQECAETKDGLHVWEDHFYPEVLDPLTGEVLPDGEEGELVFTSLTKEAMPVIRYRTRDLTRLLPGTARTMRRMEKVTGRTDDVLRSAPGMLSINAMPRSGPTCSPRSTPASPR